RIGFPTQNLSGTYTILLGPNISSAAGVSAVDLITVGFGIQTVDGMFGPVTIPVPGGVDIINSKLTTAAPHGLVNNEMVTYTGVGGSIGGLTSGTQYLTEVL